MKRQLCALLLLLALLLTACGGAESPQVQDSGPWYTVDYHLLEIPEEGLLDLCVSGDRIWCSCDQNEKNVLRTWALDGSDARSFGDWKLPEELLAALPEGAKVSYYGLMMLLPGRSGTVLGIGFVSYDVPDPENPIRMSDGSSIASMKWESREFALCMDAEGTVQFSYMLPEDYSYFRPACDSEGNLYLPLDSPDRILVIDSSGKVIQTIAIPGKLAHITSMADGGVAAVLYGNNGLDLQPVDLSTGTLGKSVSIQGQISAAVYPGALGWDVLVNTGSLLYGLNLDGEQGPVLTWLNADLDGNKLIGMAADPAGESAIALFSPVRSVSTSEENAVARITRTDQPPAQEKTVLTLACMGLDSKVAELVLHFNRTDPDYRIEVIDYSAYNSSAAPNAGYTLLNADIVSGKVPDLFATEDLPVRTYASQGLLEDLWPYIDADTELGGRDALMLPVFEAMSQGGGLYEASPSFYVNTVLGPRELVGEHMGWSMAEFQAAWAQMPEGALVMEPWMTRRNALTISICMRLDDFVDRKNSTCRFDSEEFRELVRYTELFPVESALDPSDTRQNYQRVIDRDQMLISSYLYSFGSVTAETDFLGDQAVYVGLPGASGNGSAFDISAGLAMSADGKHKDVCWRFLRLLLDKDQQIKGANGFYSAFPTNRRAFETLLAREMEAEYETDWEGNYLLDANGEKIPKSRGGRSVGENGRVIPIYPMTQEQADALMDLINTTTCVRYWDGYVIDIVTEEIGAYYAGDRSLDTACVNIQKRVQIYLEEQK